MQRLILQSAAPRVRAEASASSAFESGSSGFPILSARGGRISSVRWRREPLHSGSTGVRSSAQTKEGRENCRQFRIGGPLSGGRRRHSSSAVQS
jgi:hypothetical protein